MGREGSPNPIGLVPSCKEIRNTDTPREVTVQRHREKRVSTAQERGLRKATPVDALTSASSLQSGGTNVYRFSPHLWHLVLAVGAD